MKPDVKVYLDELTRALSTDMAPQQSSAYAAGAMMRHSLLVSAVADEFDRAAARRVEENQALRALFAQAQSVVPDAALQTKLQAAAATQDQSLRVKDLDESNQVLRQLLIELHAQVEAMTDEAAQGLNAAIWRELALSTERRRLGINWF